MYSHESVLKPSVASSALVSVQVKPSRDERRSSERRWRLDKGTGGKGSRPLTGSMKSEKPWKSGRVGLADLRELSPGNDGSLADCRLGDDQAVGNLTGVGPGAIGEAILDVVDLDGLVRRRPGQTDLDVLALDLVIELVPRDRDDINGPFPGCLSRAVGAHRIGSQVSVIVPLENQVNVMFVEDGDPGTPQLGIVSTGMRWINRVVEHDKLPVGARL